MLNISQVKEGKYIESIVNEQTFKVLKVADTEITIQATDMWDKTPIITVKLNDDRLDWMTSDVNPYHIVSDYMNSLRSNQGHFRGRPAKEIYNDLLKKVNKKLMV